MRITIVFSIFLLLFVSAKSQTIQELKDLAKSSSGQQKSQYLIQLANKLKKESPKEAFDYSIEGLSLADGNESLLGAGNALAGQTSYYLKDYKNAITYGKDAAEIYETSDEKNYAVSIGVVADAYLGSGDNKNALKYNEIAFNAYHKIGDEKNAAKRAVAIAQVYNKQKDLKEAIDWYEKASYKYADAMDVKNQVQCLIAVGSLYSNYGDFTKSSKVLNEALDIAEKNNLTTEISQIESTLNTVKANASNKSDNTDFEKEQEVALNEYIDYMEASQSKSLAEIEMLSEEMQLAELKLKAKQDEINILALEVEKQELEKQKIKAEKDLAQSQAAEAEALSKAEEAKSKMLWLAIAGLGLIVILILTGFILKNRSHKILEAKNREISEQHDEILKQTQNIEQSIDYATKIQQALLPSASLFKELAPSSFVFLKPKDNVSGDFFWFKEVEDGFIAAAADCTGHGVPGAFMSIIFSNLLDQAVVEEGISEPSQVLESICGMLTAKMMERKISDKEFKDGMDVSIVHVSNTNMLTYSGARNSIYLVTGEGLNEMKGTKRSVGMIGDQTKIAFESHQHQLTGSEKIFMFSDGFADQKGGPEGKKFYYQPFKDLLLEISKNSLSGASLELNKRYEAWRGKHEQFDDVLVVGIEVT